MVGWKAGSVLDLGYQTNALEMLVDLHHVYVQIAEQPLPDWVNQHDFESGKAVSNRKMAANFANELDRVIKFMRQVAPEPLPTSY